MVISNDLFSLKFNLLIFLKHDKNKRPDIANFFFGRIPDEPGDWTNYS